MTEKKTSQSGGTLFIVGTPIGNLEDITLRALRILKEVDFIAAEDTRRTRKLLSHYDIHTAMVSYHEHNKLTRTPSLISKLKAGENIALVSDAGMPGISDPGHDLIMHALQEGIEVTAAPGPSSIIAAIVLSGLPSAKFSFVGFLPRKPGARKRSIEEILASETTSVIFESPTRLSALLKMIAQLSPSREVAVTRELTKRFEQVVRGTASEVAGHFMEQKPRGEFVVVVHGASGSEKHMHDEPRPGAVELVKKLMQEHAMTKKDAMRKTAIELNISRREVYRLLLEEEGDT